MEIWVLGLLCISFILSLELIFMFLFMDRKGYRFSIAIGSSGIFLIGTMVAGEEQVIWFIFIAQAIGLTTGVMGVWHKEYPKTFIATIIFSFILLGYSVLKFEGVVV